MIGDMWNNADPDIRSRLERTYADNKQTYEKERRAYENKYGKIESTRKKRGKSRPI